MTAMEARYPCPVCLGVQLQKTRLADKSSELVLDSCTRCGGIWFDLGEVQHLRRQPQRALWAKVPEQPLVSGMLCHDCQAHMDRNAGKCPACGWRNLIDCPSCDRPLTPETHDGLRLDVCRKCKGVWFDRVELSAIWSLGVASARRRSGVAGDVSLGVADVLMYSPDLLFFGAQSAGMVVEGGVELLAHAPEAAAGFFEGAGDIAAAAFEAVMNIFDGLT